MDIRGARYGVRSARVTNVMVGPAPWAQAFYRESLERDTRIQWSITIVLSSSSLYHLPVEFVDHSRGEEVSLGRQSVRGEHRGFGGLKLLEIL
ncbi:unnamed protein product [Rhizoctonia solani]|uniref:Uncharacterized protein n=1 Tax=Rhizoctonia solani TaxID=456999 RepID=A0A8H3E183_9AGAM|nr:unnamed protein product [Rhizoctonia solani]